MIDKIQEWVDKRFGLPNTFNTQLLVDFLKWHDEQEVDESGLLKDEDIYVLNEADTEDRRHHFWEAGLLATCKAVAKAQRDLDRAECKKRIGGIYEWIEQCDELRDTDTDELNYYGIKPEELKALKEGIK